ncbi:MAG: serine/threonine protein kinase [Burkholderiaceae bacterium]|nr:serine/threonine protein kinase [Burkholderiaceae bacterium]
MAAPFSDLTPEVVLNAVDALGIATSGTLLPLNSYENRVFQIGVEDPALRFVVAKFYRPRRWSDAQILEEHAFTLELAQAEVPVVAPLALNGRTLHAHGGHRFALYLRRGGRAPDLEDREVRRWLGRFLARIHTVGARAPYVHRPPLDAHTFGAEPLAALAQCGCVPHDCADVYFGLAAQALAQVQRCYEHAGDVRVLRLHGDVHGGNVLWTDAGPHFVDFDDSRMGPAVQDLWMLLSGPREQRQAQLADLLSGYEEFRDFNRRELLLVEALRTLRLIQYAAWIALRWDDPAFPAAFPWFGSPRFWEERILELREQIAAMAEPPLTA